MIETIGSHLWSYLTLFGLGLLIWAALSPFETLGWWAGWFGDKIYVNQPSVDPKTDQEPLSDMTQIEAPLQEPGKAMLMTQPQCYVLFLSGVGRVSSEIVSYREKNFLEHLTAALPQAEIIDDVFPYAVNNLALTGQPFFARIWRWSLRRKINGPRLMGNLINLRNIWQILVSADRRYGPIFNQGMAEVIMHSLLRHNYKPGTDTPVFVIGYSGAGQMAVGSAEYLKEWIQAPLQIITLGGVFSSNPGLLAADHTYNLYGSKDRVYKAYLLAPGRWPIFMTSEWNRVRRQGRATDVVLGPMEHTGAGGYLDGKRTLADGTPFVERTAEIIAGLVRRGS